MSFVVDRLDLLLTNETLATVGLISEHEDEVHVDGRVGQRRLLNESRDPVRGIEGVMT